MSFPFPEESPNNDPKRTHLVIPASVPVLTEQMLARFESVRVLEFPGSAIRVFETGTFVPCLLLSSICIPPSVQLIGRCCFMHATIGNATTSSFADPGVSCRLETVTFEPGSQLRRIEGGAFFGCELLKQLCIPASVELMSAESFPKSRHCRVEIESQNKTFHMKGDFLADLNDQLMIRYCGASPEVTIPDEVEKIDDCCFAFCESVEVIKFGPNSRLSSIDNDAFRNCQDLKTITIPSSVTFLGDFCFAACQDLETVTFCPGSSLDSIPDFAFSDCYVLKYITLPRTVKTIGKCCFYECVNLEDSPLPLDSEVVRIAKMAFASCHSLKSMLLPSSLEFVGEDSFLFTSFSIPDSVEVFAFYGSSVDEPEQILVFGRDSRLAELMPRRGPGLLPRRSFLQVSTRSLKLLRANCEFKSPPPSD
jgi:hypothetical protein